MTTNWIKPVVLQGRHVRLELLASSHSADLVDAVQDGELWDVWYNNHIPEPGQMDAYIQESLEKYAAGALYPFAIIDMASGQAVGVTTYLNLDPANFRLEIGGTWYRQCVQRTALNTEAKLLLLTHAFEELLCNAVEFRTHFFNRQSRQAIERLGAKLDGVLRQHRVLRNGTLRDTCVYSVIDSEWPAVRAGLEWQLQRPR